MTSSRLPLWTAAASDAAFTDPAACAERAGDFGRQIARRNRRERIAGLVQLPFWGALAAFLLWQGEVAAGLALLIIGGGVLVVLRNLARRAGPVELQPEEPCLIHLERQYCRQLSALESVPLWYVGPLVPGVLAFYAAAASGVAQAKGWGAALEGMTWPFAVTFGIFAGVIVLNRIAARAIRADLARLKTLS